MSGEVNDRDALARIVEVVVGLGVPAEPGCNLCGRTLPCPVHLGARVADEVLSSPWWAARVGGLERDALVEAARDYREHVHDEHPEPGIVRGTPNPDARARVHAEAACSWLEQRADLMGGDVERIVTDRLSVAREAWRAIHFGILEQVNREHAEALAAARADERERVAAAVVALTWNPSVRDAISGRRTPPTRKVHLRVRDVDAALAGLDPP